MVWKIFSVSLCRLVVWPHTQTGTDTETQRHEVLDTGNSKCYELLVKCTGISN